MPNDLPKTIVETLSPEQLERATEWWHTLTAEDRRALRPVVGPRGVLVGRYVEPGEEDNDHVDFYEYLVAHELFLEDGPTFHICTAHPDARAAVADGRIPSNFRCPFASETCPMRAMLAAEPGRDLVFTTAGSRRNGAIGRCT